MKTWPDNADGHVLRRFENHGFDFAKEYPIDFDVDFDYWPPGVFNKDSAREPQRLVHALLVRHPDQVCPR